MKSITPPIRLAVALSLFCCCLPGSLAIPESWNVGFQLTKIADPVISKDIEVAVWYPTRAEEVTERIGPATLSVAVDAEPIQPIQGLILISHGFSGSFLGHSDTAQSLARNGYVVATPRHPDREGLAMGQPKLDPLVLRPRQLRLVLDELLSDKTLKVDVPRHRIGIIGYSLGAYTALVAIGATPDPDGLAAYCAAKDDDDLLCSAGAKRRFAMIQSQLTTALDSRISAAVLLAPAYGPLFTKQSVADVNVPVRIYSSGRDEQLDPRYHAQHFENILSKSAKHEVLTDAGHYIFLAPCPKALEQELPTLCKDAEGIDRVSIHQKLNMEIVSFFNDVLK